MTSLRRLGRSINLFEQEFAYNWGDLRALSFDPVIYSPFIRTVAKQLIQRTTKTLVQTHLAALNFFRHWMEGEMTIPQAFRMTQKEMRERFLNPMAGLLILVKMIKEMW